MRIPNMDSRRIKRVKGNHFTVEPVSTLKEERSMICDHCAIEKCNIKAYIDRSKDVCMKVTTCPNFVPALGFSILGGLDLPTWNTIRVGGAWADRLDMFQGRVAIVDTKNGKILRHCRVGVTVTGTLEEMVKKHAEANHAIVHELMQKKIKREDVHERMMRILKNANGTNIAAPERAASVVYLREETHEEIQDS